MEERIEQQLKRPRRRLQADTLAASIVVLLGTTVLQRAMGFGRGVLFCRWLSPETLGQWELSYSFLLTAAPLAVLGVPGSFGRYAEHFRQRGELRTFLIRTGAWTGVCAVLAVVGVCLFPGSIGELVYGDATATTLALGIGICLGCVILVNTLTSLLAGLRLYRAVSSVNFVQSVLFAVVSLAIMWQWASVGAVLIGYGVSALVASVLAVYWLWPALHDDDSLTTRVEEPLAHREFWVKLLRFAFFVWVTNLLSNLFACVDRYMLVHHAGFSQEEALIQVGHYHSSRVIPLLLVSVADLLSGMVVPHLSHDWELGRRERVADRLNLMLKLTAIGMMGVGTCVLIAAPWLFHVVLKGKYDGGLAVLPWTIVGCLWFGLIAISQGYLWCAERTKLATLPWAFGLAVTVGLNLVLLPRLGLEGAVLTSAIASGSTIALVLWLSSQVGMRIDVGTMVALTAPVSLGFGPWASAATLATISVAAIGTNLIVGVDERGELTRVAHESWTKVAAIIARRSAAPT